MTNREADYSSPAFLAFEARQAPAASLQSSRASEEAAASELARPKARPPKANDASARLYRSPGKASLDKTPPARAADRSVDLAVARTDAAARILEEAQALLDDRAAAGARAMPRRVAAEPGFVLHVRPWSESSLLLDVFSLRYGRVFLIAKGAKRPSSQLRGLLVPFSPLRFTWTGRNEAKVLVRAEWLGSLLPLEGDALMSGFYVNELILRMTEREDPAPALFAAYVQVLAALGDSSSLERQRALRVFEMALLRLSGWPLAKADDASPAGSQEGAAAGYIVRDGLLVQSSPGNAPSDHVYDAHVITALLAGDLSSAAVLRSARDILREVIQHRLGTKTLRTRRVLNELKKL